MAKEKELDLQDPEELAEESPKNIFDGWIRTLIFVLPLVWLPATAGAYLAYNQYPTLAHAALAVGIDFGLGEEVEEKEPIVYGEFHTLTDILVNPAGSKGKNILMLNLHLETRKAAVIDELGEKDIVLKDKILQMLSQRTFADLSDITLRQEIKDELLKTINALLTKGEVDRLYFTQYILQ